MSRRRRTSPARTARPAPGRRFPWRVPAGLSTVVVVIALTWWLWPARVRAAGPVILISIDTLRADHLPAYGYKRVRTAAIDALAGDGMVFENAYSHSPQTLPSHVSILS